MKMCELLIMKLFLSRSIQIKWIFSIKLPINFGEKKPPKLHGMKLFGTLCEMVLKIKTRSSGNQTNWLKKNTSISWNRWTLGLKCLAPHVNWISKRYQVHLEPNKLSPNTKHEHLEGQLKQLNSDTTWRFWNRERLGCMNCLAPDVNWFLFKIPDPFGTTQIDSQ